MEASGGDEPGVVFEGVEVAIAREGAGVLYKVCV